MTHNERRDALPSLERRWTKAFDLRIRAKPRVHAVGVRLANALGLVVETFVTRTCMLGQSGAAGERIGHGMAGEAGYLGQRANGPAPIYLELPQAVLGGGIALALEERLDGVGGHVRDAVVVTADAVAHTRQHLITPATTAGAVR